MAKPDSFGSEVTAAFQAAAAQARTDSLAAGVSIFGPVLRGARALMFNSFEERALGYGDEYFRPAVWNRLQPEPLRQFAIEQLGRLVAAGKTLCKPGRQALRLIAP